MMAQSCEDSQSLALSSFSRKSKFLSLARRLAASFAFAFVSILVIFAHPLSAAQLPVRVFTWDAAPTTETIDVWVPGGANPAAWFYARIHNIRFGGQVSMQVNGGDWINVFNHTVTVLEPERSQGGIGGINGTVRIVVPLAPGDVTSGLTAVSFRLNGTDAAELDGVAVWDETEITIEAREAGEIVLVDLP